MASFQLALALVILSFWCATASPTPNGTVPPLSTQPIWPPTPRNSKALVGKNKYRQAETVPCDHYYILKTGQTTTIQSPNYPDLHTTKQKCYECKWNFQAADPASRISITCSNFTLSNFPYSYMRITGQGLMKKYSGVHPRFTEVSGNNQMEVLFHSKRKSKYRFSCIVAALGCGRRNPWGKIIGGNPTNPHEYPWHVGLTPPDDPKPFCGGSIISDQWILTAARCVNETKIDVVIGEHDWSIVLETVATERRPVFQIIPHKNFNPITHDNDIALIQLKNPITFPADNKIAPVCLPDYDNLYENVTATVTGWGLNALGGFQPFVLHEVDVPTMTNMKCNAFYGNKITNNMLCAGLDDGGKDSCQGDSGGPLVTYGNKTQTSLDQMYMVQIGIVSWGESCAQPKFPGVYTRVGNYLNWIAINTAGSLYLPRPC